MAKRTADLMWVSETHHETKLPLRKRTARPPAPPLYKASIKELAETGTIRVNSSTADIDNEIVLRIKKCLERASHPNTPEAEAKAAVHLASRLMGRYNVSQAEVLTHEGPDTQKQYAGLSSVSIERVDGDESKSVNYQSYVNDLCCAMQCFFDCKSYSAAKYSSVELTFYGIAENTVAAAMSFEMTYNLIAEWARPYKGIGSKNSYSLGISNELYSMAKKEKALEETQAKEAEREAIAAERKKEDAERQAQLARLAPFHNSQNKFSSPEPTPSADAGGDINGDRDLFHDGARNMMWQDSKGVEDDGSDGASGSPDQINDDGVEPDFKLEEEYDVNFGDLDEEISKLIKPELLSSEASLDLHSTTSSPLSKREPTPPIAAKTEQKSSEPQELEPDVESKWASHMQLVTFRATATKIADEYLKDKGVKLHNRSTRYSVIRDWEAYDQGVRDSKNIDVRRKKLNG